MTTRVVVLVLLAVIAAAFSPGDATAQGFNAVYSKDGIDVWAVGNSGAVYRSLNSGGLWGSYPLGTAALRGVAARASNVWILGDGGALWTSTDNGVSFSSETLGDGSDLLGIWFASDTMGWICGKAGTLFKTTDAGLNWVAKASNSSEDLRAVRVDGAGAGWACGTNGTVLSTEDNGESWVSDKPFSDDLLDIDFDGSTLYVSGTNGLFAKSSNGGASWTEVNMWLDAKSDVRGVDLLSDGTLWLCGGGGFLRKSVDGGATFTYPQHNILTGLTDVYFSDTNNGWACARLSNNVLRTTNGGATWTVPGNAPFTYTWSQKQSAAGATIRGDSFDIDARNRNKMYVVMGKTVYISWNLGENWTSVATISGSGVETNAFYVSHSDSNTWVAAVQAGDRITKTTDGGATWTTIMSASFTEYGVPLEQDPNNPNVLYFGPEDGRFYKSTNFGSSFFQVSSPGFRSPCDIEVVAGSPNIIWVGDGVTGSGNGQMFRSTNGGVSFSLIYTTGGSEVPMIGSSWLDPAVGFSSHWSSGGIRRTTDYGFSWPQVATTGSAWGVDCAKDDPYCMVYGVYSGSTTYASTVNGNTGSFITASLPGSNYGLMTYERGTWFALQSGGVYKANINQIGMPTDNSQALAVLAPDGGEQWQYNEVHNILWSGQNLAAVKIEYQNGPVAPWQLITPSTAGASGSYPWVIPNDPTLLASVRVSDAGDGTPVDQSLAVFSILVPTFASDHSELAFGQVPAGPPTTMKVAVSNTGTGTLVISSVTVRNGGPFVPNPTSFSIASGLTDTLEVTFTPPDLLVYTDTLDIVTNSPESPIAMAMSGEGVAATGVNPVAGAVPARFELRNSSPNPFGQAGTNISYSLPKESDVSLVVYNVQGQEIATLFHGRQPAGVYSVDFPARSVDGSLLQKAPFPSGVYFYRLSTPEFTETKRMVMVR